MLYNNYSKSFYVGIYLLLFLSIAILGCKNNSQKTFDITKAKKLRKSALRHVFANNIDSAILYFDSSLYYNSEYPEAYAGKSLIYLGQDNHKKAMKNINLALKYDPNNLDWHFNRAHILYETENYRSASKKFYEILEKADKKWLIRKSYYKLGLIKLSQQDTTKALEHFYNSAKFGHSKSDSIYNKLKHSGD